MVEDAVFRVTGLHKAFGPIEILKGIDLSLPPGKVTVLMGANGAGKSTLVRVICGVYTYGAGKMELAGKPYDRRRPPMPSTPVSSPSTRTSMTASWPTLTSPRTSCSTGSPVARTVSSSIRAGCKQAEAIAKSMMLHLDLNAEVSSLSLADRQLVAIARAMARKPRVMILDEPTSSLSSAEANRLFELIERLRDQGVAILYISHRMSDIRRLADRIMTLRDGVITGTFETEPLDYAGAVDAMLGRQITRSQCRDAGRCRYRFQGQGPRSSHRASSLSQ